MNNMKNMFFGLFFVMFAQGCATVGMAIDGGKELVTDTVDTVVGTASNITIAVAEDVQKGDEDIAELIEQIKLLDKVMKYCAKNPKECE